MNQTLLILEPLGHMYGVILSAKKKGYKIITLGKLPINALPPYEEASQFIDMHIPIDDWYDFQDLKSKIKRLQKNFKIVGVYACAEVTLTFEAYIRQELHLKGTPYPIIVRNLNKYNVRKILNQSGLSNLKCLNKEEIEKIDQWPFSGKAFFKPVSGAGSAQVWQIENLEGLYRSIKKWKNKSEIHHLHLKDFMLHNDQYFIEEEAKGHLFSVESFVYDGIVTILGMTTRTVLDRDPAIEMELSFPFEHEYKTEIYKKIKRFHHALGIQYGPTHTEIMVNHKKEIELVEMNLRFAGSDMLYVITEAYGMDIAGALVDLSVGKNPNLILKRKAFLSLLQIMPPVNLTQFISIEFPKEVIFSKTLKLKGDPITSTLNQADRIGSCIIKAKSYSELLIQSKRVKSKIKINGRTYPDDPNSLLRSEDTVTKEN